ncbi:tRNA (adenosine(37)-N6)-threonylcarbamoyltransferase complex ATPase subunit type 1 TsaE [Skermanella rosea]|uniref:tRNA (adenosine(37)-N6)-threonylcarbamoyltransferase complex ATPase subunit type 1 TsaE n=1 Tax=Skermanella rosea TaxID=1817965 RepID=UPI00193410CB|nr:tRNA (adenosine(37)-N6)-threonylcarbamoyltransferase complex ATPase subunit type 1 TsaE [Skermanella rosea]UEM05343.1 tRNA (adenosine(37)-N6)-threonylcarbamoyltransferase complex ATPase subunit type 1 TsaE [Skermanella rosea]
MTAQRQQAPSVDLVIDLGDEAATADLARRVGSLLRAGDMVALRGDLGAGKTAFARALIQSLGDPDDEVPSPTFTLVQTYDTPAAPVWHFDLYRLGGPDEVIELGWDEVRSGGIALVEWPDRLGSLLPPERLDIALSFGPEATARRATLTGHGGWADRLGSLEQP